MRGFIRYSSSDSAISKRFEQILQEKISTSYASSLKNNPTLGSQSIILEEFAKTQLESKDQDHVFKHKYQRELAYVQSEDLLRLKQERENADPHLNRPWLGSELVQETARRMIIDSMPKAKKIDNRPIKTIISPSISLSDRIQNAKELSLDYKVGKTLTPEEKEKKEFQELYKERLLGPSMFLNSASSASTVGLITSMADARINAEIDQKTGTFKSDDMQSVRGKPLDKERLANSADTAYFMNEVMKKQDCLPPWIENQRGVDVEISNFRLHLRKLGLKALVETTGFPKDKSVEEIISYISERGPDRVKADISSSVLKTQMTYLKTKTADINQKIRNYNLLAPSSALHKWKIVLDSEVMSQVAAALDNIEEELRTIECCQKAQIEQTNNQTSSGTFLGLFSGEKNALVHHSNRPIIERPTEPMRFWHLFKSIFKD